VLAEIGYRDDEIRALCGDGVAVAAG